MTQLTVANVESIHHAVINGRSVDQFVNGLTAATLPALLEYQCMRRVLRHRPVPPLPSAVLRSELGVAYSTVVTGNGNGHPVAAGNPLGTRSCEFTMAPVDLEAQPWQLFLVRFQRSATAAGIPTKTAKLLATAMNEMVDNAIVHSQATEPATIGYWASDGKTQFTVADSGIGILASLRSCSDFQHITVHNAAIREALHDGVSRYGHSVGDGTGFGKVFKALTAQWGHLRFRSGEGCISMDGNGLDADHGIEHFPPPLPGFQVTIACHTSPPSNRCQKM